MKSKKKICRHPIFLSLLTVACFFLISACKEGSGSNAPPSNSGKLSFSVIYPTSDGRHLSRWANINCVGEKIANVEAKVYDPNNDLLKEGGPWNCELGAGTINSVPSGSDRTVVLLGTNANGKVVFRGAKSGIEVEGGGAENDIGPIECQTFAPRLIAPANGLWGAVEATQLDWSVVDGATEYQVIVSQNIDLTDAITNQTITTTELTVEGLSICTAYYWQVVAVGVDGKEGIGSEIGSFEVIYSDNYDDCAYWEVAIPSIL